MPNFIQEDRAFTVFQVLIPCHQEFFCRLVERFPRTENGLLGGIDMGNGDMREMDLMLLRNIADFPIHIQRKEPEEKLLTARFKASVNLLARSIDETTPDMDSEDRSTIDCPPGEDAEEQDFSGVSDSSLWAGEVLRIRSDMTAKNIPTDLMAYLVFTQNWMHTSVVSLLGIQPMTGPSVQFAANARKIPFNHESQTSVN
ncbi:hypothetical protein VNI00_011533 [Paramarasmius palmivorus]|uniref:Uncharacterized protein n=1 Tax=Paramarasmius palmivorus TaxID=297713 RepID=A0AAW0CB38_9AGAR